LVVGEGRWGLVMRVVAATLAVAPKGLRFVGVGMPMGQEGLEGFMQGCTGRLGKMVRVLGTPKSSEVAAKATTD